MEELAQPTNRGRILHSALQMRLSSGFVLRLALRSVLQQAEVLPLEEALPIFVSPGIVC